METHAFSKTVWAVSLPIVFAEISETIVHVTDTAFLARVGVAELGAIALADTIYELATVPMVALVDGIQILTARRAGQRRDEAVGETFNLGLALLTVVSLVLTLGLRVASPRLTGLVVASDDVGTAVEAFVPVVAIGTVFHAANLAYSALLVTLSRTRVLIPATILLAATNLFLGYCLVFGNLGFPRLGIEGAAWGSVGAEVVTCAYLTAHVLRHIDVRRYALLRLPRLDGRLTGSLCSVSFPVGLQALMEGLRWFVFFVLADRLGEEALATSNVVYSFYAVLRIPTEGFSETTCSMVSHMIGSGRARGVEHLLWEVIRPSYLVTLPFAALILLFPRPLLSLFVGDPQVIEASVRCLRVVAASMLVVIPGQIWFVSVSGTGDTRAAFLIELALTATILLVAYVAGFSLGLPPEYVWTSLPLGWLLCLSLSYRWVQAGRWRRLTI
ncbi:MAG: MATE family efflux transporter [Deltaproteobacteria bacterium]|nr:MAG: MATE family efflux transporter [Deltaproteobacteria bacterium]